MVRHGSSPEHGGFSVKTGTPEDGARTDAGTPVGFQDSFPLGFGNATGVDDRYNMVVVSYPDTSQSASSSTRRRKRERDSSRGSWTKHIGVIAALAALALLASPRQGGIPELLRRVSQGTRSFYGAGACAEVELGRPTSRSWISKEATNFHFHGQLVSRLQGKHLPSRDARASVSYGDVAGVEQQAYGYSTTEGGRERLTPTQLQEEFAKKAETARAPAGAPPPYGRADGVQRGDRPEKVPSEETFKPEKDSDRARGGLPERPPSQPKETPPRPTEPAVSVKPQSPPVEEAKARAPEIKPPAEKAPALISLLKAKKFAKPFVVGEDEFNQYSDLLTTGHPDDILELRGALLYRAHLIDFLPGRDLDASVLHIYTEMVKKHIEKRVEQKLQKPVAFISPVEIASKWSSYFYDRKAPELEQGLITKCQQATKVMFVMPVPLWNHEEKKHSGATGHFLLVIIDREHQALFIVDSLPHHKGFYEPIYNFVQHIAEQLHDPSEGLFQGYKVSADGPEPGFPLQIEAYGPTKNMVNQGFFEQSFPAVVVPLNVDITPDVLVHSYLSWGESFWCCYE
ncbi:hypothetical protein cyc_06173 [Cyclospora cayetanensis]|uniref:Ubiquitin-like protease family profile domain-containing protein n=1 Tax=Cyclospora cayetanensis TaxID=88456 RepID=A0A1D3D7J3_9EIME|nr:hypothetical protein cyc_06173 [Cyclospora cayetanensis]